MPILNFLKSFVLKREDGTEQFFRQGTHEVSDDDAQHWYVRSHTDNPPQSPQPEPDYDLGETVRVNVVKAFTLTRNDGRQAHYRPGEQDMPKVDAEHYYTQHHLENPPEPAYPPGTPQYAEMMAKKEAEARQARMVREQRVHQAAEQARAADPEAEDEDEPESDDDRRANRRRKRGRKSAQEKAAEAEHQAAEEHQQSDNEQPQGEHQG